MIIGISNDNDWNMTWFRLFPQLFNVFVLRFSRFDCVAAELLFLEFALSRFIGMTWLWQSAISIPTFHLLYCTLTMTTIHRELINVPKHFNEQSTNRYCNGHSQNANESLQFIYIFAIYFDGIWFRFHLAHIATRAKRYDRSIFPFEMNFIWP